MVASLGCLLDGVFDYAGLFPPARMEMPKALDKYIRLIEGKDEWIVSRFVCTASSLVDLAKAMDQLQRVPEIPISVVGQITTDYDEWAFALERDAGAMTAFINRVGDAAALEAYEVRIPSHNHIELCIKDLSAFSEVDVFVELPWADGLEDSMAAIAITEWIGAKARTGGVEASAFPDAESLAGFLHSAYALDVPVKLTAGLHHPLPSVDDVTGGRMHGFLNVLTASALCGSHDLSRKEIAEVLRDDSIRSWAFGENEMSWKGQKVLVAQIEEMRDLFLGIGSCSIDEPIADLSSLGLIREGRR